MKIYKTDGFHHKNEIGIKLLPVDVFQWNKETDGIIISNNINEELIHNPQYERVVIGPGVDFSRGLSYFSQYNGNKKIIFNCLSPWLKALHEKYAPNSKVQYECIPFPVDTDKFKPVAEKKRRFFVYYKNVHSSRLNAVLEFIYTKPHIFHNYEYRIFSYGQYQEDDYLNYIQDAEFGVWVGSHESQGFAFEEALSCGCPLFVYDVKTLKDECIQDRVYPWGFLQGEYSATAASYFDETCGLIVKEAEDIPTNFDLFFRNIGSYKPREYVLNHLTAKHFYENVQSFFPETKQVVKHNLSGIWFL